VSDRLIDEIADGIYRLSIEPHLTGCNGGVVGFVGAVCSTGVSRRC
jgi:hypothetical protein